MSAWAFAKKIAPNSYPVFHLAEGARRIILPVLMDRPGITNLIKTKALELGFARCGIAPAEFLDQEAPRFQRWLEQEMYGEMAYMSARPDVRLDPRKLLEGAKSVICVAQNYYTNKRQLDSAAPRISKYAQGGDYHRILRTKVGALLEYLRGEIGHFPCIVGVDSNTVLEKAWAARAGIGWVGKNSLIMNRDVGSFMFLAVMIVDFELEYDQPVPDSCASCHVCIDACPTGAIVEPRVVDPRKCISYWTIEMKGALPESMKGKLENWVYGCDICQDVCPCNRKLQTAWEPQFDADDELYRMTADEWYNLTQETFNRLFAGTPLARGGLARLKRNLDFLRAS